MKQPHPYRLHRLALLGLPLMLLSHPAAAAEPSPAEIPQALAKEAAAAAAEAEADAPETEAEKKAEERAKRLAAMAAERAEKAEKAEAKAEVKAEEKAEEKAERAEEKAERAEEKAEKAVEEKAEMVEREAATEEEKPAAEQTKERARGTAERPGRSESAPGRANAAPGRAARAEQLEAARRSRAERQAAAAEDPPQREVAEAMPVEDQTPQEQSADTRPTIRPSQAAAKEADQPAEPKTDEAAQVEAQATEEMPPATRPERTRPRQPEIASDSDETAPDGRRPLPPLPEDTAEAPEIEPETEPERQAETQVREATQEVERELSQRAAKVQGRQEARALIEEIIGAESRISRAEIAREERIRPRMEAAERRRGVERIPQASPEIRREAIHYFQQRLRGQSFDGPPPELLQLSENRRGYDDRRRRGLPRTQETRRVDVVEERVDVYRPRYLNQGRRYVHYDSQESIPAILLAAEAMNHVRFQPAREVAPVFYEERVTERQSMPLPPEEYRNEDALVVSYPVDEKSMISSDDILFQQGSTQFADPYSYEIVSALGDAMKNLPEEERFVIEGHASAEGSYASNMTLSQQRAERIVREMVRRGVSPYRLLPVGYGESEARHPADAAEPLRQQDRRVMVFRLNEEPVASR